MLRGTAPSPPSGPHCIHFCTVVEDLLQEIRERVKAAAMRKSRLPLLPLVVTYCSYFAARVGPPTFSFFEEADDTWSDKEPGKVNPSTKRHHPSVPSLNGFQDAVYNYVSTATIPPFSWHGWLVTSTLDREAGTQFGLFLKSAFTEALFKELSRHTTEDSQHKAFNLGTNFHFHSLTLLLSCWTRGTNYDWIALIRAGGQIRLNPRMFAQDFVTWDPRRGQFRFSVLNTLLLLKHVKSPTKTCDVTMIAGMSWWGEESVNIRPT